MDKPETQLSIASNLKIALFHLGSGMADVLTTGVWNRIMISDLGFAATPIGLLVSLRYFLAPLGIVAGRFSDRQSVGGYRRLVWIWLGRLMMVLSTIALGYATAQLATDVASASPLMWGLIVISLLLFSTGNAISGSTFLALIYDRAPESQRGRAVGIVWTFLLLGFTVGGIFFGILLPENTDTTSTLSFAPADLFNLFIMAAIAFAALWFFSLVGEERRNDIQTLRDNGDHDTSLKSDLKLVWKSRNLRFFLIYLVGSMFFAFSQDLILEPFAGDVFGMEARITNRFAAYWGSMAIIGSVLMIWLSRRYPRLTMTLLSQVGTGILLLAFGIFAMSSLAEMRGLVTVGLIVLGIGLGIWNIGTLGLMMAMSPVGRAGTFLGFWTFVVTLARGAGVSSGGIFRDISLGATGSPATSYGLVFVLGVFGLGMSMWALSQVNVKQFRQNQDTMEFDTAAVLAGAMD
ncbi:MAG: BCD family MFS transporter [Aggregatilineales bacterium]